MGEGSREAKRTILLEDIIYAGKGRVATALVAKWGPTLSYIPAWIASVRVRRHSVPGDSRYALLRVIPICRWHPPRRQQHRGPFRLRSSLPLSDHERAGEGNRLRLREKWTDYDARLLLRVSSLPPTVNRKLAATPSSNRLVPLSRVRGRVITILFGELLCLRVNRRSLDRGWKVDKGWLLEEKGILESESVKIERKS